jgi:hypothetical protein
MSSTANGRIISRAVSIRGKAITANQGRRKVRVRTHSDVIAEEEEAVMFDRPAETAPELLAAERSFRLFAEIGYVIVRVEFPVALEDET